MTKILTVTLKEMEIVETDGGFEKQFINEQRFPASITNYSLSMGEKLGLIESSQLTDLADVQQLFESAAQGKNEQETLQDVDLSKFIKVIYLAVIGVNPNLNLTYDEFTKLYHENHTTTIETYTKLVLATLTEGINNFADGMKKSTKKKLIKTNRNHRGQKSNV